MGYTIAEDGDDIERQHWDAFAREEFPSYETFWEQRVVPVTRRPHGIDFKTDRELAGTQFGPEDIAIAQLHYTCLLHLGWARDLHAAGTLNRPSLIEALSRLISATDVADELLQRRASPGCYDPWSERDGRQARREWRNQNDPLKPLRNYRNHLVHGRVHPQITVTLDLSSARAASAESLHRILDTGGSAELRASAQPRQPNRTTASLVPKRDKVTDYLDWRRITNTADAIHDFAPPGSIVSNAWRDVLEYLEHQWKTRLIPG